MRGREEVSKRRDMYVGLCCPTSDPDAAAAREARLEAVMAQKLEVVMALQHVQLAVALDVGVLLRIRQARTL